MAKEMNSMLNLPRNFVHATTISSIVTTLVLQQSSAKSVVKNNHNQMVSACIIFIHVKHLQKVIKRLLNGIICFKDAPFLRFWWRKKTKKTNNQSLFSNIKLNSYFIILLLILTCIFISMPLWKWECILESIPGSSTSPWHMKMNQYGIVHFLWLNY